MGHFIIKLRRGTHTQMKEEDKKNIIFEEGEPFLEFQDQYKGWYMKFMNPVRLKIGDGKTCYKDLPFLNRKLKPIAELCIEIGLVTIIQIVSVIMFLSTLYL